VRRRRYDRRDGYRGALGAMTVIDVYLFYRPRKGKWL
jgi:hypothetical protein